ncbi:amino acid ABC transporter substrate-binding protein [Thermus filiformis]|uniref:Amino acid ABC transporter substrate-binding protein n=1 Tax=Thermus filiformis TaxID=276 RepID=A0A0A2WTS4_THEFI|nr:radical SAM protein [Thermus filiformis]KGQ21680.2 amino acid ABC transporter substrate-binding protein [Thermus filiformis]
MEFRPEATVVGLGDRVLSFDREGRLYHFFDRGRTYRRALDGSLHLRHREGERKRRRLGREEALEVYARAYRLAEGARLGERREEVLRWSPEALLDDTPYRLAYTWPVSILPPDQYLAVVLQATFGCTWNRCLFCTFYQDRAFRARPLSEFLEHLDRVRALLGRGVSLRRGVFLGDGNALALGERLIPLLEAAQKVFPQEVAAFLDVYTGVRKEASFWERLRALGLRRVYLGLETGSRRLLRLLNKPGDPEEALELVRALKRAGLWVGVILMVGAGGRAFREEHFAQSLDLLARLGLEREDLVYLSPFVEDPASPYARLGLEPLDPEEELPRFARAVRGLGLRAARYDIREFLY